MELLVCLRLCVCSYLLTDKIEFLSLQHRRQSEMEKIGRRRAKTENLAAKHMKQSLTYLQHGEALILYV